MKIRAMVLGATVIIGGLGACGSDDSPTLDAETTTTTASGKDTAEAHNDADVTFAQSMIPHHEQAVEMADIALDPTVEAGDAVKDLATRIKGAQDPEIAQMTEWLQEWGEPLQMDTSDGHDMSSMEGMMSAEEMDALGQKKGPEFDKAWMQMMIEHHEGAIAMAETANKEGRHSGVLDLADAIITAQQKEIDEMKGLLAEG